MLTLFDVVIPVLGIDPKDRQVCLYQIRRFSLQNYLYRKMFETVEISKNKVMRMDNCAAIQKDFFKECWKCLRYNVKGEESIRYEAINTVCPRFLQLTTLLPKFYYPNHLEPTFARGEISNTSYSVLGLSLIHI